MLSFTTHPAHKQYTNNISTYPNFPVARLSGCKLQLWCFWMLTLCSEFIDELCNRRNLHSAQLPTSTFHLKYFVQNTPIHLFKKKNLHGLLCFSTRTLVADCSIVLWLPWPLTVTRWKGKSIDYLYLNNAYVALTLHMVFWSKLKQFEIVGAARAATPFLRRRARSARRPKRGSGVHNMQWLFSNCLTDYELISRREVAEKEKLRHHSIPWQFCAEILVFTLCRLSVNHADFEITQMQTRFIH